VTAVVGAKYTFA